MKRCVPATVQNKIDLLLQVGKSVSLVDSQYLVPLETRDYGRTEGPLREPLGTAVYRHCWFRRTQLEHAGFSAGQRVFFLLSNVRITNATE
jgi:hypothetical protein